MRVPRMSAGAFRRLTTVNLVLLVAIVVSGAIVRLTNSGLGCRDWPNCSATQFVSVATHHAAIEQINRIFSGAIGIPLGAHACSARTSSGRGAATSCGSRGSLFGLFWCEAIARRHLGGGEARVGERDEPLPARARARQRRAADASARARAATARAVRWSRRALHARPRRVRVDDRRRDRGHARDRGRPARRRPRREAPEHPDHRRRARARRARSTCSSCSRS